MTDWEKDCLHWRDKVLVGKFAHWCADWDYLPIDETTPEWPCVCTFKDLEESDMGYRETICLDFDGVVHSYDSGWKGATNIPDPPVPGAFEFIANALEHYDVAIFSARSHEEGGPGAIKTWMLAYGFPTLQIDMIRFPKYKPPAHIYIDDRGYLFTGTWPTIDELKAFKPWNKRPNYLEEKASQAARSGVGTSGGLSTDDERKE